MSGEGTRRGRKGGVARGKGGDSGLRGVKRVKGTVLRLG